MPTYRYALAAALLMPLTVNAQGLRVMRPLPGYACAMLNLSEGALRSGVGLPPVLALPSASATKIGTTSGIVIVTSPPQMLNGYVKVLHLDGRLGWVEARQLRAYRSLSDPNATCTPALMADGRPGFS